tara:strand:+ start:20781 stop:20942 length:162 start_codon:yes stop_codon:yes gene_type:complete
MLLEAFTAANGKGKQAERAKRQSGVNQVEHGNTPAMFIVNTQSLKFMGVKKRC